MDYQQFINTGTEQNMPVQNTAMPVRPDGTPYSKEDYSALSNEYKSQRDKIVRSHNTLGCVFMIIGMIFAGIWLPINLVTHNTALSLIILGIGIVCLVIGGLQKPFGDKKINSLQEQSYTNYINNLPDSSNQQSNTVQQSTVPQSQANYINYQPTNPNTTNVHFCPNCGNKLNPESIFCAACGTKVK